MGALSIEEAVGIVTSSIYIDPDTDLGKPHLEVTFPWGARCPDHGYEGNRRYPEKGDIYVVKTHYPFFKTELDTIPAIRSVRIVRHPVDSFYSFYISNPPNGRVAPQTLQEFIITFRAFHRHWDLQPNVLTVRYEDLYNSPKDVLRKILTHIGYKVSDTDIERALLKYPPKGGTYKYIRYLHPDDLKIIESRVGDIMRKYQYTILNSSPVPQKAFFSFGLRK